MIFGLVAIIIVLTYLGIKAEIREYRRQERFAEAFGELFADLLRQSQPK